MTSSLRRHLLLAGALLAFSVLLVAISSRHHDEFASPDEPAQLDYVLAIPHVPATGDLLSDQALEDLSTNGLADGGYSSAGATPPVYYVVTAVVARPVAAVTGWSVLSVARWTGVVWLALFVAVAAALARALGVPPLAAVAAPAFAAASNSAATSAAYLGSDTAGAVAGGLVLLMAWRYDGTRRALLWLAAACALAALTKLAAATAVVAAMVLLVVRATAKPAADEPAPSLTRRAGLLGAAAAAVAFLVPAVLWVVRTRAEAEIPRNSLPSLAPLVVDHVDWSASVGGLLFAWDSPIGHMWAGNVLFDLPNGALTYVMGALLTIGVLAAALTTHRPALAGLGGGLLLAMVLGPFAVTELVFLLDSVALPVEARFGLGLLAGMTATAAWLLRDRPGSWALTALVVLSVVNLAT